MGVREELFVKSMFNSLGRSRVSSARLQFLVASLGKAANSTMVSLVLIPRYQKDRLETLHANRCPR